MINTSKKLFTIIFTKKKFTAALLLTCMIVAVIFLNHNGLLSPETIFRYLKEHQIIAPFIFISIYVILTITMLPTLPFNLGAGFLWGAWIGMAYSVIAASIGAILAFLISRHLLSDSLNKRFNHKIWLWLQNEIEKKDWKIVAFTRINPIFPFGLTNYFYYSTIINGFIYWRIHK